MNPECSPGHNRHRMDGHASHSRQHPRMAERERDCVGGRRRRGEIRHAAFGWFRDVIRRPGYRFTVENTVHVRGDRWGSGVGRELMEALIDEARRGGKHTMVAAVDGANEASIGFHQRLGFVEVARMPEIGAKFGRSAGSSSFSSSTSMTDRSLDHGVTQSASPATGTKTPSRSKIAMPTNDFRPSCRTGHPVTRWGAPARIGAFSLNGEVCRYGGFARDELLPGPTPRTVKRRPDIPWWRSSPLAAAKEAEGDHAAATAHVP